LASRLSTVGHDPDLALESRRRIHIPNGPKLELNPALSAASLEVHRREHPAAKIRRARSFYNCFGLAFAGRRTWVFIDEDAHLADIFDGDSYRRLEITEVDSVYEGDLVLYKSQNTGELVHVGVIIQLGMEAINRSVRVLSKWGEGPEVCHLMADVPASCGFPAEFWTDREATS
jgi:hypothetical protein